MGQTLSEPVTETHTTTVVRGKKYWVGLSDMQGWRITMEDSHSVHLYLPPSGETRQVIPNTEHIPQQPSGSTVTNDSPGLEGNALFGVFDGHGGSAVAKFVGSTLHSRLTSLDSYKKGSYEAALKEAFLKSDEDLRADPTFFNDPSGCTAVVSLVTDDGRIIVANSGDSRAVLGYKGVAKELSHDHKPTNTEETARITAAGGFVEFGRVNGNLALSRAIGDFEFKKNFSLVPERQVVTADPEITIHQIDSQEEFIVLACDGIWDCLSSQQVVDFVRRAVAHGDDLSKVCENLMAKCLATDSGAGGGSGIGCDNMTVVVVALLGGKTPEEWKAWVKERVDNKVGHETPESIPDVFKPSSGAMGLGGIGGIGGGFRMTGAGGFANIASILNASGITLRPVDDSDDDDDELKMISGQLSGAVSVFDEYAEETGSLQDAEGEGEGEGTTEAAALAALESSGKSGSVKVVDEDGDSTMDSGDESDATTTGDADAASSSAATAPTRSFTSIGSPNVPSHQELTPLNKLAEDKVPKQLEKTPGGDAVSGAVKVEGLMDTSESPMKM